MKRTKLTKLITVAFAGVICAALIGGCTSSTTPNTEQIDNRAYMSQVNVTMGDLQTGLDSFNEAVSRNDLVGMRTQASNAFRAIDSLNAIEPPEDMKDIQASYVDGSNDLLDALNLYIELFTEVENATEADPFDYSTYDARLQEIQDLYDSGIAHLEAGDTKATDKPQ